MATTQHIEPHNYYSMATDMIEKFGKLNEKVLKNTLESMMSYTDLWQECINAHQQRLSTARNPNDLMSIENNLVSEYAELFTENLRQDFKNLSEVQSEFMHDLAQANFVKEIDPYQNPFVLAMQAMEQAGKTGTGSKRKGNSGRKSAA